MIDLGAGYVLIVDDRPERRDRYRRVLLHAGLRVIEAADGDTAVDLARAHVPDLVLLDVSHPRRDGLDVARRLDAEPRTRRIPVLRVAAPAPEAVAAIRRHLPARIRVG